ncbi:MAG: NAD-dependent epimerase/dehydratase family protein [Chitinivibrionales bacterium]|nr:NAD-dependent epimerase/dehydratase family protein [Chitinivibrionales bacterium]MBD3393995.1 NAD-dependent epimerase/dehydratase family protein [Chitinivibrionales bacterium]
MVLVTGAAGFIGFHVARALLERGERVVGIDSVNNYYDPALKEARLRILHEHDAFAFERLDICDYDGLARVFGNAAPEKVCHLAAQAGVRYSLTDPFVYQKSNNEGFLNLLECARHARVSNFVFASTSSVYGANTKMPFSEADRTDTPMSLYAATKKANEVTAHAYSRLFGVPCSGLRFFTVYGPWGRPDMALFIFTKAILEGKPVDVFNFGKMKRNFTYVDDIVQGVLLVLDTPRPYEIYNIGNDRTVGLLDFVREIEHCLDARAAMNMLPMQPGDIAATEADIRKIRALGYAPATNVDAGVREFVNWYRQHYHC